MIAQDDIETAIGTKRDSMWSMFAHSFAADWAHQFDLIGLVIAVVVRQPIDSNPVRPLPDGIQRSIDEGESFGMSESVVELFGAIIKTIVVLIDQSDQRTFLA